MDDKITVELEREDAAALIRALDAVIGQDPDAPPEPALRKLQSALVSALGGVRPGPPQVSPGAQPEATQSEGDKSDD
jgi:hypothetical protein